VLAAAGMTVAFGVPGSAGAQEEKQPVDVKIDYLCGTAQVTLSVTATFPAQGTVGDPVQPSDVTLALSVPPDALTDLTAAGAVSATSVARLDTEIIQGETRANATWTAVRDEPVPLAEPTVFTGSVEPEEVTAGAAGDLSFTAAGLVATVTGRTADGAPTEPPSVDLICFPAAEEQAGLAVVPVSDDAGESTEPTTKSPKPELKVGEKEAAPPTAMALGDIPAACHKIEPPPVPKWSDYCANMAGYSNVAKLNTSILQPAGLINIAAGNLERNCDGVTGKFCSKNTVLPELDGEPQLPPAPGSFFVFGFIPVTGTMQLTQLGLGKVEIWFIGNNQGEVTARLQVTARLFDTEINGLPIDLGPNCETATPIDVVLKGNPNTYSITRGGVLTGMIEIPEFSGCGVNEDLDPLISGLVSGPGNFVKMTQGPVCSLGNGNQCPPAVPIPQR
jgi:hypothetical protein